MRKSSRSRTRSKRTSTASNEFGDELRRLGVELKDPVAGLVDFLTQIDGREAYLCWKLGEGEIAFWHELNAGFGGRQSLLEGSVRRRKAGRPGQAIVALDRLVQGGSGAMPTVQGRHVPG